MQVGLAVMLLMFSVMFFPSSFAEPTVKIVFEQTTFHYCDKLFYSIEVSEVTGDNAVIFIRDESGRSSSGIPISISESITPVPSPNPFEKGVFPLGKYFIDVEYGEAKDTAEFELQDSEKPCISIAVKSILSNWLSGNISDGFLLDAIERFVDREIISIPYEINESNVYDIDIPEWFKNVGFWWVEGFISDETFANAVNYLLKNEIITNTTQGEGA